VRVRFVALLLLVVVMVAAVGCRAAGEETTAKTESTAGEKTITGHTLTPSAPQDSGANDSDKHILRCQVGEASKYNGEGAKQGQFVDEVYQEARERGVDPERVLSERGYDCGWSGLQQRIGKR
jgi:hypothetical protein